MSTRSVFLAGATSVMGAGVLSPHAADALPLPIASAAQRSRTGRRRRAYDLRRAAAESYLARPLPTLTDNGDEARYDDKRASFSKTLPHDDLGHVDRAAYAAFCAALRTGKSAEIEAVPRDSAGTARLNNPQATYSYEIAGLDSYATQLAPPPQFASAENAIETTELYWQMLTLDVPFAEYERDPLIAAATAELRALWATRSDGAAPTAATIFREGGREALGTPYISQFLYADVPYGQTTIEQRYRAPLPNQRFNGTWAEWLACQRGVAPAGTMRLESKRRYIVTGRDLAEYVHTDFSFQPYLNAALIALSYGSSALSPTNPYRGYKRQSGDITLGNKNVFSLVAQAALLGQKGAWYHKWQLHRRVRPEALSGRIENHVTGRYRYDLHDDLLRSDGLARARAAFGTALLASPYVEGCPTHPSYPAAHAANAGACGTILKAFFDGDFVLPKPVQPSIAGDALEPYRGDRLTLGGEIDKLCMNVALGRDFAGVHYRSDSVRGVLVGEQQGIALLQESSHIYNERFDGFVLRTFAGNRIRVRDGRVTPA